MVVVLLGTTVKPRPEARMDMILFEVFLKNIHLIPQVSDSTNDGYLA